MSVCFLVSYLACLFFLAVGFVYQATIQSLHFSFLYIENTTKKNLILHYGICSFGFLVLILIHMEILHFIEIVEVELKFAFKKYLTIF
jgi:hypothetical protein